MLRPVKYVQPDWIDSCNSYIDMKTTSGESIFSQTQR